MVDRARLLLNHWLETQPLGREGRLPAERVLAAEFGVSRAELRKALADIEADGRLIRHVGRGTFLVNAGGLPPAALPGSVPSDRQDLARRSSPHHVLQTFLTIEPSLARMAAIHATANGVDTLRAAADTVAAATSWELHDQADNQFHRLVADLGGNPVLLGLFDLSVSVRRDLDWGMLTTRGALPSADHPSLADHAAIVAAIAARDQDAAERAMRHHRLVEAHALLGALI